MLTRYTDTAPVDYMIAAADGEWVPASEALALEALTERQRVDLGNMGAAQDELRGKLAEARAEFAQLAAAQEELRALLKQETGALTANLAAANTVTEKQHWILDALAALPVQQLFRLDDWAGLAAKCEIVRRLEALSGAQLFATREEVDGAPYQTLLDMLREAESAKG